MSVHKKKGGKEGKGPTIIRVLKERKREKGLERKFV